MSGSGDASSRGPRFTVTGEPLPETMWVVARRPRWIGMLVLALVIAGIFAWLGHWQVERSIESAAPVNPETETVKPLTDVAEPQSPFPDRLGGQMVSVSGEIAPGGFRVIADRVNQGEKGYWLIGRLVVDGSGASVPVALGWGSTADQAAAAEASVPVGATGFRTDGRYFPSEAPSDSDFQNGRETVVSVAELVNEWSGYNGDVYGGYVVASQSWGGLAAIDSPAPDADVQLNWLNIFYAVEWAVFAVFAVFLWFRLVRDAYERELDEAEEDRLALAG
ncbi:SURF1 family protein [Frigoribacterium sp. 2-23]|uniref:SURF1 family protein n=1 Tax=Frigoribacterium sp. 2-23 TaxID=3415006 RepID=UPI003C706066